jgi:uncharacterized protein
MSKKIVFISILVLSLLGCRPKPDFVEDRQGVLSSAERGRLVRFQGTLLRELDIHLKLVVLDASPGDLDALAAEMFDEHGVGGKTGDARGVLILVDPTGRQVRVEIGYGLEGIFPDAFVGHIERNQMVPFFQANRVGPGIEATVELLVGKALERVEAHAYDPEESGDPAGDHLSGGAGARVDVTIGSGQPDKGKASPDARFEAQATPLGTLETYKEVLRLRIKDPDLEIFTPRTRAFFRKWLVTDAQQENELRSLLQAPEPRVLTQGERAVIRFPVVDRQAVPLFLRKGEEGWMLDFASMHRFIGFNHRNQWHLKDLENPYMFAFQEWRFDANGFPHPKD